MVVIAIFRVIKAPFIDGNLSIIDCYAEAVHVFRNFVHVIKNRLVGAPVHVIEKTVHVHENCCSRVLRILKTEQQVSQSVFDSNVTIRGKNININAVGNQTSAGVFANANSLVAIGDADQSTINISSTNSVTTGKEGALRQSCG